MRRYVGSELSLARTRLLPHGGCWAKRMAAEMVTNGDGSGVQRSSLERRHTESTMLDPATTQEELDEDGDTSMNAKNVALAKNEPLISEDVKDVDVMDLASSDFDGRFASPPAYKVSRTGPRVCAAGASGAASSSGNNVASPAQSIGLDQDHDDCAKHDGILVDRKTLSIVPNKHLLTDLDRRVWDGFEEHELAVWVCAFDTKKDKYVPSYLRYPELKVMADTNVRAGAVVEHAEMIASGVVDRHPRCHFKFGLARNPIWRFSKYQEDGYGKMVVLATFETDAEAALLEACMIRLFSDSACLDNIATGGERPPPRQDGGMVFVYIVIKTPDMARSTPRALKRGLPDA